MRSMTISYSLKMCAGSSSGVSEHDESCFAQTDSSANLDFCFDLEENVTRHKIVQLHYKNYNNKKGKQGRS